MIILPAIDLKEGKCVRLEQGLMDRDTVYHDNPAEQARIWQEQGGELLHIVDLDGAFAGVPKNREAIKAIVEAITIPSELGGGIRLDLAQYRELAAFAQFASDLDDATRAQLELGERVTELMKQAQYSPLSIAEMAFSLFAANEGYLNDVDVKKVVDFEEAMLAHIKSNNADLIDKINETADYNDEIEAAMRAGASDLVSLGLRSRLQSVVNRELRGLRLERALNSTMQSAGRYKRELEQQMQASRCWTSVRAGGSPCASSTTSIQFAGHTSAQAPQPVQNSALNRGRPRKVSCGSNGSAGNLVV